MKRPSANKKPLGFNKKYIRFIGLHIAFGRVNCNKIFKTLKYVVVKYRNRILIHALNKKQLAVISYGVMNTKWGNNKKGSVSRMFTVAHIIELLQPISNRRTYGKCKDNYNYTKRENWYAEIFGWYSYVSKGRGGILKDNNGYLPYTK